MATARQNKQNLQFTLLTLEIPSLRSEGAVKHLLTTELVWPRTGIARRSSTLTLPLVKGVCATDCMSLAHKLCFKETCEGTFGFTVSLSESITTANVRKFTRYFLGQSAKLAADVAEDAVPIPVLDEVAQLPLLYLSKQLLADADPTIIAEGCLDLDAESFSATPVQLTVPLTSSITTTVRKGRSRTPATVVRKRYESDGVAVFSVTAY